MQQLFTIRRLTLMLKRTGSIRRTCFQTCCFFGVFIFFFKRPRAEIITCRLNPCLFKLGNQERTERVTFFSPGFVGSDWPTLGQKDCNAMWALGMFNLDLFRCRCADAWGKYKLFIFTPAFLAVSSIIQSKQWCRPQRKHGRVTRHKGVEKQVPVLVLQNSHLHEGEDSTHYDISFKCLHKKTHTHIPHRW